LGKGLWLERASLSGLERKDSKGMNVWDWKEWMKMEQNILEEQRERKNDKEEIKTDVLILGSGPSGLTSAIFTARAKLKTIVLEEAFTGGQVTTTYQVANYPGTQGVVNGLDLVDNMKAQVESFDAQILEMKTVQHIELEGEAKRIYTPNEVYVAKSVILSTGAQPRKLPIPEEEKFKGKGIHYCATCDGAFYHDKEITVVGGGLSALEEAQFLTRFAKKVTLLNRKNMFKAPLGLIREVENHPKIEVRYHKEVQSADGSEFLESIQVVDTETKALEIVETDAIFVYIGLVPKTNLFHGKIKLSDAGYILTDEDMATNVSGVFACGDVREKSVRQIATAVGDGAIAGVMAERHIKSLE
jgi:thioredoxin reductase (NADPH)